MLALAPEALALEAVRALALVGAGEARRAHAAATRALPRAEAAGRGFVALRLEEAIFQALAAGALGPTWALAQVRSFVESMRRRAEAAKRWLPAAAAEECEMYVAQRESDMAAYARAHGADAVFAATPATAIYLGSSARICAQCTREVAEMPRCGRCRSVWYCSPACQKAHWPEHKAACKAAAAARAGAGSPR